MAKLASQFVALPPQRRALAFAQTAARMAASSVMVEKDFWVCWLLGLLFADTTLAGDNPRNSEATQCDGLHVARVLSLASFRRLRRRRNHFDIETAEARRSEPLFA